MCDQCCGNLFWKTPFAWDKAVEWSERERDFEKRAGFSLMAYLAVHAKRVPDERFLQLLPIIRREAGDNRNFVRKAVNWALRQIGKRDSVLNEAAIETANDILSDAEVQGKRGGGRWVASDALRELTSEQLQRKLAGKKHRDYFAPKDMFAISDLAPYFADFWTQFGKQVTGKADQKVATLFVGGINAHIRLVQDYDDKSMSVQVDYDPQSESDIATFGTFLTDMGFVL